MIEDEDAEKGIGTVFDGDDDDRSGQLRQEPSAPVTEPVVDPTVTPGPSITAPSDAPAQGSSPRSSPPPDLGGGGFSFLVGRSARD